MRRVSSAVLCLALAATPAQAQSPGSERAPGDLDNRVEVFGTLGWGRVGGDEGSRGSGPVLGGGVGYRLTPRVGVEVDASILINSRDFPSSVRIDGTALLVSGNLLYHFSESRNQVYAIGGLGMLRTDQTFELRNRRDDTRDSFHSVETFAAWNAGVGLKAFVTPKLIVRPEIRYYSGGSLGVLGLPRVTVAIGYCW